jgi:hypothetical protein
MAKTMVMLLAEGKAQMREEYCINDKFLSVYVRFEGVRPIKALP